MVQISDVRTPTIFERLTPHMALFIAHAMHTARDPASKGESNGRYADIAAQDMEHSPLTSENERAFRGDMFAVISSAARSMTRMKEALQHDLGEAEDQNDDFEEQVAAKRFRVLVLGWMLKFVFTILGAVAGGIAAAILKPYFPTDFGTHGASFTSAGITIACGMFGLWFTTQMEDQKRKLVHSDAKWLAAHSRLMHADERMNQYKFHRDQLCRIYLMYTKVDYSDEPDTMLLSMQGERQLLFDLANRERRKIRSNLSILWGSFGERFRKKQQQTAS